MHPRPLRWVLGAAALVALGCSGLFSPVTETDALIGEPNMAIPVPSAEVARGFDGPEHRARVVDAMCAGSIPVWGEVAQGVHTSDERGELADDIDRNYISLVARCTDRGYCRMAREKLPATIGQVHDFWLHALATCGEMQDRPLFRDLDTEALAVVSFYTAAPAPLHREGADDGALILAVERLVQRGVADDPLPQAIGLLLAWDAPEAAERLAALAPSANLNVADLLYAGLAGQSHPDALAAIEAYCQRNPEKLDVCSAKPKAPPPDHATQWLDALATTDDPERAMALLEAHPELRDRAAKHLEACGGSCDDVRSLLDGDDHMFDEADEAGVTARPDRVGSAAFDDSLAAVLEGRGRIVRVQDPQGRPHLLERAGRTLARAASPDLDDAVFYTVPADDGSPGAMALEVDRRHFEIPLGDAPIEAIRLLVNHVLGATGSDLQLVELIDGFAAVPEAAVPRLDAAGLTRPE